RRWLLSQRLPRPERAATRPNAPAESSTGRPRLPCRSYHWPHASRHLQHRAPALKTASWWRAVVKVGPSTLTDAAGHIEPSRVRSVAAGAQALARAGAGGAAKVVIVSSGAGAAGRERLGLKLPLTLPEKQAAAAVGQVLLMQVW